MSLASITTLWPYLVSVSLIVSGNFSIWRQGGDAGVVITPSWRHFSPPALT